MLLDLYTSDDLKQSVQQKIDEISANLVMLDVQRRPVKYIEQERRHIQQLSL